MSFSTPEGAYFDDNLLDDGRGTVSGNTSTKHFKTSLAITFTLNFIINGAIGYALVTGDRIRLWENGTKDDPHGRNVESAMIVDMMISGFIVSWLNWIINAGGVRKAVAEGKFAPVPERYVRKFPWSAFPLLMSGWVLQALLMALEIMLIGTGLLVLVFLLASVDDMDLEAWFWLKGFWVGLIAAATYWLTVASWTTYPKLPQADIDAYTAVRTREEADGSPYGTG